MIYKGDSTYFESIPKEYIEPIRDIITMQFMLNQVLYDIGKGITHKSTRNLQNMRSCINAVLGKIKQIKEQDFFNESVIATIL